MIDKNGEYVNERVRMSWVQDLTNAMISTWPANAARVREALRGAGRPSDDRAVYRFIRDGFWEIEDSVLIDTVIAMDNYLAIRATGYRSLLIEAAARGVDILDLSRPPKASA